MHGLEAATPKLRNILEYSLPLYCTLTLYIPVKLSNTKQHQHMEKHTLLKVGLFILILSVRAHAVINTTTNSTINDIAEVILVQGRGLTEKHSNQTLPHDSANAVIAYFAVVVVSCIGFFFVFWSLCSTEGKIASHATTRLGEKEYIIFHKDHSGLSNVDI